MIALFFEVTPNPGQDDRYLEIAASLKPEVDQSGGVLFLDRFRSLARPRVMLSHQIWADEASLARWRANGRHYGAQTAGRSAVFEDYRLRIGAVIAEVAGGGIMRHDPGISYNDPARTADRLMVVIRSDGTALAPAGGELYRSVYKETAYAWVGDATNRSAGLATLDTVRGDPCVSAAQLCLVSRDYGLFDRREAPQYFPPRQPS